MATGRYGGRAPDWQRAQDAAVMGGTQTLPNGSFPARAGVRQGAERRKEIKAFKANEAGKGQGSAPRPHRDAEHGEAHDVMTPEDSSEFENLKAKRERGRMSDHEEARYEQLNAKNGNAIDAATMPRAHKVAGEYKGVKIRHGLTGGFYFNHKGYSGSGDMQQVKDKIEKVLRHAENEKPRFAAVNKVRRGEDAEPPRPSPSFNKQTGTATFQRRKPAPEAHPMSPEGVKRTGGQFGQKIGGREAKTISALLRGRH